MWFRCDHRCRVVGNLRRAPPARRLPRTVGSRPVPRWRWPASAMLASARPSAPCQLRRPVAEHEQGAERDRDAPRTRAGRRSSPASPTPALMTSSTTATESAADAVAQRLGDAVARRVERSRLTARPRARSMRPRSRAARPPPARRRPRRQADRRRRRHRTRRAARPARRRTAPGPRGRSEQRVEVEPQLAVMAGLQPEMPASRGQRLDQSVGGHREARIAARGS